MATSTAERDPYFIDFPQRIQSIQREMEKEGLDVYLGSRLEPSPGHWMPSAPGEASW